MKNFFASHRLLLILTICGCVLLVGGGLVRIASASVRGPDGPLALDVTPIPSPSPAGSATATLAPTPSATAILTPTPTTPATPTPTPKPSGLPRFDHVVVVIEENHSYSDIIGQSSVAPYINALAAQGMVFANSHAITHPSQPNYLDLFSGSDQGVVGDTCIPGLTYPGPDLGGQMLSAGLSFAGYSEGIPSAGYTGCSDSAGLYARKHNPWANFSDVDGATTNLPFSSFPTTPAGFSALPTLSFVVPNLQDDMHDGTIQQADSWLKQNMSAYAQWAITNNSLLIITWDEAEDANPANQILTLFVGQHVQVGTNNTNITHFDVLRTLEDMYGLPPANNATTAHDITGVWN
jgi:hypothetical protein